MNLHRVLEHGPIVGHDEEAWALVTVNGVYLNLWIGRGDHFENVDCRHVGSRADGEGLRELSVAEAMGLAAAWLDELRGGQEGT